MVTAGFSAGNTHPTLTFHSPFRSAFPAGGNSRRDTTAHEINVIDELTATGWVSE